MKLFYIHAYLNIIDWLETQIKIQEGNYTDYYIQHLSQIGGCFQLHASKNAQFSFRFMSPCDHARLGFRFLVKTGEDIWNISD